MIDDFLSRLDKVRQIGPTKWTACCPAHNDKNPSMALWEQPDGRVGIYCSALCDWRDILSALSLEASALFPAKPKGGSYTPNIRRPFGASDLLRLLSHYSLTVYLAAGDTMKGRPLSEADHKSLFKAVKVITAAAEFTGLKIDSRSIDESESKLKAGGVYA
jgi:hypothetical protein